MSLQQSQAEEGEEVEEALELEVASAQGQERLLAGL